MVGNPVKLGQSEYRVDNRILFAVLTLRTVIAVAAVTLPGCVTEPSLPRIDNIPMYGQPELPRPELLTKADEDFIKQASSAFGGSREAASKAWFLQGERFMNQGNLDYAMRRYNQSWLLNPNNSEPYWGFGRVMVARDRLDDAIEYFEKSKQLEVDSHQKPALLSDTGTAYSYKAYRLPSDRDKEKARYFEVANQHFSESIKLDPSYSTGWEYWAFSLYREAKYAEAWEKVKKARSLGGQFTDVFITNLSQEMPEPK